MLKKCTIKITETDHGDGEEKPQSIEITTEGVFRGTAGDYTLRFDEIFAEDIRSHTVITVRGGKWVGIVRHGDITTEITVELGQRHNCHYATPYGEFMIGIHAESVEDSVTENGGKLRLVYTVDYYANVETVKEMEIEVKPTVPAGSGVAPKG